MRIVADDLTDSEVRALLELHARGMEANSPPGACHYFDLAGLQSDDVTVWSIWDADKLAGCGALREIDTTHGEVKSMRTHDSHLGKGVGRQMVDHIIEVARQRGYRQLSLETGSGPAFAAAIRLYETSGFEYCGPFDDYEESDSSVYMTLELGA